MSANVDTDHRRWRHEKFRLTWSEHICIDLIPRHARGQLDGFLYFCTLLNLIYATSHCSLPALLVPALFLYMYYGRARLVVQKMRHTMVGEDMDVHEEHGFTRWTV